jgi:hypothetical protein
MSENLYFGAYWGNRKEGSEDCARRTAGVLRDLSRLDGAFTRWFGLGASAKEALQKRVETDEASLVESFQRGRNRRDTDRNVMSNLGHRIRFWNGLEDRERAATFSVHCGSFASTAQTWIPNSCVIELPASDRVTTAALVTLVESVATNFEPDWAVVNSDVHRERGPQPSPGVPLVGWITYLSAAYGPLPALPRQARVMSVQRFGVAVITTDERFTATNPDHVKMAEEIRVALDHAGLLRRIA